MSFVVVLHPCELSVIIIIVIIHLMDKETETQGGKLAQETQLVSIRAGLQDMGNFLASLDVFYVIMSLTYLLFA
jgi:hypothetical protein